MKMRSCLLNHPNLLLLTLSLFLFELFQSCSGNSTAPPVRPATLVSAATVIEKDVPVQLHAIGNVEAYNTVSVKPQVGGELIRVHFTEGQHVKKGDLLFTIDPRPYEMALKQAEANLAKDTAQLENAHIQTRRYDEIAKQGIVSQEMYDQVYTNAAALESSVKADKAVVENARLQLQYCYITAPLSGVAGNLIVDQGNVVKANPDIPMVVINRIQPVYVSFSVPEQYLPEIQRYRAAGTIEVDALVDDNKAPVKGELTFIDNSVDSGTGTIKLKATFTNEQERLWPGQFVTVVMILGVRPNAVVVPSRAVQAGQEGEYVFVVNDDLTVKSVPVTVGETVGDESIIQQGLQPGAQVVTDGQLRLFSGAKVRIKSGSETVADGGDESAEAETP
jgi:multidrug efflux system membrane fusion protein